MVGADLAAISTSIQRGEQVIQRSSVRGDRHESAQGSAAAAVAIKERSGQEVAAEVSSCDPAAATVGDVGRAGPSRADEHAPRGENPTCSFPPDQRVAGVLLGCSTAGVSHSRNASE